VDDDDDEPFDLELEACEVEEEFELEDLLWAKPVRHIRAVKALIRPHFVLMSAPSDFCGECLNRQPSC
jgi:hypothetical protein